jgi:hypothetical protein
VTLRLAVGQRWAGESFPRSAERTVRFVLIDPEGGAASVPGAEGADPAGTATVSGPGLYLAAYQSNNGELALGPSRFADYLRLEGLEAVLDDRRRRGEEDRESHEVYARCAKSLLHVAGRGEVRRGFDRVIGLPLELIPEADPYGLAPGADLALRLLYLDTPLAGALVVALPRAHPEDEVRARTDGQGRVVLRLPTAGVWLVKAVHMVRLEGTEAAWERAEWQSYWASLTFALPSR